MKTKLAWIPLCVCACRSQAPTAALAPVASSVAALSAPQSTASQHSSPPVPAAVEPARHVFDHALLISVDGLRSDALIAGTAHDLPGFSRLRSGASTLNARTDPDMTVTLPNHTAMLTGRPVMGPDGHGWTKNDDADPSETLHSHHGSYLCGIFDVAHDRGFKTALFAGKTKFSLYDVSWNETNGAPDVTGEDDGRDKIDVYGYTDKTPEIGDDVIKSLGAGEKTLVFAHFAITDFTAHAYGWDVGQGSKYLQAVASVDREIVRILDAITASELLRGKTAIVLTTDHGGGAPFKSHDQAHMWIDYTIPFIVWTGDGGAALDLYAINPTTRKDPSISRPRTGDPGLPPIRNADAGNLVLDLLGLPPIPGSVIDREQDLSVVSRPAATTGAANTR